MKYASLILCALALAGCETTTHPDGRVTERFDWNSAAQAVDTGFKTYDQYQRASYIQGYDVYGNPIYRQQ